ncbi:MAG: deoxyribodipyrimidine photo-lyase [Candidatus Korobacteraceae bacterium]
MKSLEVLASDPRVTVRKAGPPDPDSRCVVYWMQRSQRGSGNPALDTAIAVGNELGLPVVAFLALIPFYPNANFRHYQFLAEGISGLASELAARNVGLVLRTYPDHSLMRFCEEVRPALLIGDENPMREPEEWRTKVARRTRVPLWTVDSDVVVPSKLLGKEHYAARTIRPRLRELLPDFLEIPAERKAHIAWTAPPGLQSLHSEDDFFSSWTMLDRSVQPVAQRHGGPAEAQKLLSEFVKHKLRGYPKDRNHPEVDGTSRLSAYLHFGHIGPRAVARAVEKSSAPAAAKEAFLEQLIVRRELAINFVRFNPFYDTMECMEPWADRTLAGHARDRRPVVYSDTQLESAETHDPLWNAAQKQMVVTGWMHNYMRMYWAKKILEWSPSIADAYRRAVWLNDRYELDGRDPNGYAGIAWAIVGKHDRPWFDRPIFGTIRYMSLASTSKKFDSKRYIQEMEAL